MAFRGRFLLYGTTITLALLIFGLIWNWFWWLLLIHAPIFIVGLFDVFQKRQTLRRNYPIVGHGRYIMEKLRPKIYQYFVESDLDGRPYNRVDRSIIYQRAKKEPDSSAFGTQLDVYEPGHEWVNHSLVALNASALVSSPRIEIGGPLCTKPYSASLLNVSAMSFGALSKTAIQALNGGAKLGGFYHNTGEGGISPYHLAGGGDLVWQLGTGYFGARDAKGNFSASHFQERALIENVKMIEIKLSQGAKPGHGGILPASKNTQEISQTRGVQPHTTVISPPTHSSFSNPIEMLEFIQKLRELSGGKPVGFKICVGRRSEFLAICKAMTQTQIYPDFITVDGAEGGTGASLPEFSNHVGTPLQDGLTFVYDALVGFDLKDHIKIIAAGKISTGFNMLRTLALGADLTNSARSMMMALGCIQALECDKNSCPTGIATQNKALYNGLDVGLKKVRVANYQRATLHAFIELLAATGLSDHKGLNRSHIYRRMDITTIKRYDEIYPYIARGCLKDPTLNLYPERYKQDLAESSAGSFVS